MKPWTGSTRHKSKHSPLAPTTMKMPQHTRVTSGWVLWEDVKRPEKEKTTKLIKLLGPSTVVEGDLSSHPGSVPLGFNFSEPVRG